MNVVTEIKTLEKCNEIQKELLMAKDKHAPAGQMDLADTENWALGHGGRRNNAGRKNGEGSKTMRIPTVLVPVVEKLIMDYKQQTKS